MKAKIFEIIKDSETMILSTGTSNSVTMRTVSPVYYQDKILIFTSSDSNKYKQLKVNPNCCVYIDNYFLECYATFNGSTMLESNKELRDIYSSKFKDAFNELAPNNGMNSEFILLEPKLLTGWNYEGEYPTSPIYIKF